MRVGRCELMCGCGRWGRERAVSHDCTTNETRWWCVPCAASASMVLPSGVISSLVIMPKLPNPNVEHQLNATQQRRKRANKPCARISDCTSPS